MSAAIKELADYARFLRNAAPQEFGNFYLAFEKYTQTVMVAMVDTIGEDLLRAQGRAQQSRHFLRMLEEIKNG